MKIVKISHMSIWSKYGHWDYKNQTPNETCIWGDFKFEINNNANECDFWIVHGTLDKMESCMCAPENVILVISEEIGQIPKINTNYLAQFGAVITSRSDINHKNVIKEYNLAPWSIKRTYTYLSNLECPQKTKDFSALISNNQTNEGHRKRYEFTKLIKNHFKDKLDWYCKGEKTFVNDKWDGLASYKYSLAIENYNTKGYFTEKITDCFLAYTMPIYYGCPDIFDYFPEKSMVLIDINNVRQSIIDIERAIEENWFEKNFVHLEKARSLALNDYHFIASISRILNSLNSDNNRQKQTIKPEAFYDLPKIVQYFKKITCSK